MKTQFYLNRKKATQKAVKELIGEERLKNMLSEAKETFKRDPAIQSSWYIGDGKMLTIEFC